MNYKLTILGLLVLNSSLWADSDYKEKVSNAFEKASAELKAEEQKFIDATPQSGREKIKKAFIAWREWAKLYVDSKYSEAANEGSVAPYYRMEDISDLYLQQIEWIKKTREKK